MSLWLLLACAGDPQDTGPAPPRATVHLDWVDHPGTWTTALGWTVTLDQGWLVSLGAELLACTTDALDKAHGNAVAAHLHSPHVEALHDPVDHVMGTLVMDGTALCTALWHVGRPTAADDVADLPTGVDLVGLGLSLYLRGVAEHPDHAALEFEGGSAAEGGNELALEEPVGDQDLDLHVVRDPAGLFEGIDFAAGTGGEVADAALVNLVLGSVFEVE